MSAGRRELASALLAALVALSLVLALRSLVDAARGGQRARDAELLARFLERFDALRADLPATGVVAYLNDPVVGCDAGGRNVLNELRWTQYALLPLQVVPTSPGPLVVANFHDPAALEAARRRFPVASVRAYGSDLYLLTLEP